MDSSSTGLFLKHRVLGFAPNAFDFHGHANPAIDSLAQLTPGKYLSSTGLWIGLAVAVVFLAAAIWQRRYRGPI